MRERYRLGGSCGHTAAFPRAKTSDGRHTDLRALARYRRAGSERAIRIFLESLMHPIAAALCPIRSLAVPPPDRSKAKDGT